MPPPAVPSAASTPLTKTGPSPDKMTFSAKKRFFEKEIVDSTLPVAKPGKRKISSSFNTIRCPIDNWKTQILMKNSISFPLAERRFSFLSEDEVNKLRQEEGKILRLIAVGKTLL